MVFFVIRRLLAIGVMLVVTSVVTFLLFFAAPTDPAALTCGRECTPDLIDANRHAMGLDKPIYVQYGDFVKGLFAGRDFPDDPVQKAQAPETIVRCEAPCLGYSFLRQAPVTELVTQALPITVSLAVGAFVLWMLIGVLAGCVAALYKGRWLDRLIVGGALLGYSLPTFFIGLLLLTFVSIRWAILPIPSYTPFLDNPLQWAAGLVMPWTALAVVFAAAYVRLTRAYMIESLSEDYVRTARAKGVREPRVIVKHGLRVALTPIVTMAGLDLGGLLGGMVVTEQVFGFNGLGKLAVQSVTNVDLPTIVAVVLVAAAAYTIANLVVDILYGVIDPRVRLK